jgi:hypothetical protein
VIPAIALCLLSFVADTSCSTRVEIRQWSTSDFRLDAVDTVRACAVWNTGAGWWITTNRGQAFYPQNRYQVKELLNGRP